MGLTRTSIEAALARGSRGERVELTDDREPGLRLRAGTRGAKWSVLVRAGGDRRVRVPLGRWPALGIAEAREEARKTRRTIEQGGDPSTEHRGDPAPKTVAELLELYDSAKLQGLRSSSATRSSLVLAIKPFRDRPPNALTRADVAKAIDAVARRAPVHANRMLAYLSSFFGWAVGRGLMETNPAASVAKPAREVARERTPSVDELARIWLGAEGIGYPFGDVVRILMLTASRREEVAAMRVDELHFEQNGRSGVWTIPAYRTKTGRSIRVPLSALAVSILQAAIGKRPAGSAFVFTTTGATSVSGWSKAKTRLDRAIGQARGSLMPEMAPWRLHDLRRSFATMACDVLRVEPAVADRCLNHVGASTTSTVARVYARSEMFEQRRDALERWSVLVAEAVDEVRVGGDAAPVDVAI